MGQAGRTQGDIHLTDLVPLGVFSRQCAWGNSKAVTEALGLGKGKENTEGEKGQKDGMTRVTKATIVQELTCIQGCYVPRTGLEASCGPSHSP